ncbi:class I SAM-dependent methyltransferase [Treponema parvum]|uniref:Class I SAM-dependent methyltransferase n=1 Tax=Treponema parvum TaxID=138851 RepID=A0A975IDZ2_9SPIR|nr:class I SAM-dependent methyltransferase [Treponema parvum]QTQ13411.1 class I SAM-dependent methyltransferase [Treponema parvum]
MNADIQVLSPNGRKKEWFENEDFWNNFAPIMFDAQRWAEAPTVADSVCKIAGLGRGSSVLDAGCGPGRIAIELALKGISVTGVDLIQSELDAASETAEAENVNIELIKADLRTYKSEKKFDAAVSLYTSFGYCESIEDDMKILKHICDAVKDDGWFILECTSRETAILYFTEGEWFERAGKTVLTEFSVTGAWEGLLSKWILIDNCTGARIEHEFVQRLYSAVELKRMMTAAGFKSAEIYGDFDFSPYDQKARTMVIVARK